MASRYPGLSRAWRSREEDEDRGGTSSFGTTPRSRYSGLASAWREADGQRQQQRGLQDRSPATRAFLGSVRTVAGGLEPLQLPKDIFDAIVAGGLDDETTVTERLSRLDLPAYVPFGRAPARPSTGYEVMELMGIKDENAKRWGGVVFDLTADPLLAGSALRAGGRVVGSTGLQRLGSQVDNAFSPAGLNRAASRYIPGKQWVDRKAVETVDRFLNARVFWSRLEEPLTYGDHLLTRTAALSRQFPGSEVVAREGWETIRDETGRWVSRNRNTGQVMQNFGREAFRRQSLARQTARQVPNQAVDLVKEAQDSVLGEDALPWLQRAFRIIGRGRAQAEKTAIGLPANVRDTVFSQGYEVGDQIGMAVRDIRTTEPVTEVGRSISQANLRATDDQLAALRSARERVAHAARAADFDETEAVRRFDQFVDRITEADALLGYHLSGFEHVRQLFYQSLHENGWDNMAEAHRMWTDVVQRGMRGEAVEEMRQVGGVLIEDAFQNTSRTFGRSITTLGDVIGSETSMRGLDLTTYLKNLREGHLRRSYGLFQSPTSFRNYIAQVRTGRLFPTNIVDDTHVRNALGEDTAEARAFYDYLRGVGRGIRGLDDHTRGVVLRQSSVIEGMRDMLMAGGRMTRREANRRATEGMGRLIKQLQAGENGGPLGRLVDRVADMAARYERSPTDAVRQGLGRAMFREREDLGRETLEMLGELATPQVSIMETARAARSQIAFTDYLSGVYDDAVRRGYVTAERTVKDGTKFKKMNDSAEMFGPFAGKYMHPYLKKELERAAIDRSKMAGNFQRLRTLITGGYLASPNVITANLFGGIYTTALLGISPLRMFRELGATFREFRKASRDPNYSFDALEDLKLWQAVDDTTLIDANVDEAFRRAGATRDIGSAGIQRVFDDVSRRFQSQLDAPAGQRWAGLEGFQFVENWMKVSAFQAARRRLAAEAGVDMAEFSRPFANRSTAARSIDPQAAEVARQAVFDYSDIPESLRLLRDSGLLMFPGFPYFLTARTVRTALERPGILATSDRLADAINNAQMDPDTKRAVYGSMADWLKGEQGVVVPWRTWEDEDGNTRRSVIPFNQLIPTSTLMGNPWGESLATLGIYKPFVEVASAALITRDGEAPYSARYGQRVYEQGVPAPQQVGQAMGFLMNTLSPGVLRKVASYTPGEGFSGLGVSAADLAGMDIPMNENVADSIYRLWEVENERAQRRPWDQAVAATIRSPQVITLQGPLANIRKNIASSEFQLEEELRALEARRRRALLSGNQQLAERIQRRIDRKREQWINDLRPALEAWREWRNQSRDEGR